MAIALTQVGARATAARGQTVAAMAYRPDIDGLRALAVACVLGYHAFPAALTGGFVGVDVFFVISGFLITRLVLTDIASGDFGLPGFYARRLRRLAPALLAVLAASAAFAWYALTPVELKWLGAELQWGAAFLRNAQAARSGDYFDESAAPAPLVHLWSLGVEEQFYLLWPLLLLVAARYGLTRRTLAAVAAASLAISVWGALTAADIHFYRLSARAWELALGGLVAVQLPAAGPRPHSDLLSIAGAALVVGGSLFLDGNARFPGWWALVPSGGAALMIAAGAHARLNRRVLATAPMVFIGRISYSLYLWHWPVLAFARITLGHTLAPAAAAGALVAALLLATVSYYLVELPVRFGRRTRATVPLLLGGLGALSLTGLCLAHGWIPARNATAAVAVFDLAAVEDWGLPGKFALPQDLPPASWKVPTRRARTALFIGDSHVAEYWSRALVVAQRDADRSLSVEFITYAGCPPLPSIDTPRAGVVCAEAFDYAAERAFRSDVETVVFGALWEGYFLGESATQTLRHPVYSRGDPLRAALTLDSRGTQRAFADFQKLLARLVAGGRKVYILLSGPTSPLLIPSSLIPARSRLGLQPAREIAVDAGRRNVDVSELETFVAPVTRRLRELARQSGARVIDPVEYLCNGLVCPAVSPAGVPLYRDSNHVRPSFARERAWFIDDILLEASDSSGALAETNHAISLPLQ